MDLNTRESALLLWGLIVLAPLLVWSFRNPKMRRALVNFARTVRHPHIVFAFLGLVGTTGAAAWALSLLGLWTWPLLKDTVLWAAFTGVSLVFSAGSRGVGGARWRRLLADQLKVVVVLTYLANSYTFSFVTEFWTFLALALVSAVHVGTEKSARFAALRGASTAVLGAYGLLIVALATHHAVVFFGQEDMALMLRSLALGPLLSLSLTPFLFALYSASWCNHLRVHTGWRCEDPAVVRYARRRIVRAFALRPWRARGFLESHGPALFRLQSKGEIDELLANA